MERTYLVNNYQCWTQVSTILNHSSNPCQVGTKTITKQKLVRDSVPSALQSRASLTWYSWLFFLFCHHLQLNC